MRLVKQGARYVAQSSYEERHIPKAAGFRWDGMMRVWYTDRAEVAARLRDHAEPALAAELPEVAAEPAKSGPVLKTVENGFVFDCGMDVNGLAKAAGFRWMPSRGGWFTADPEQAAKLIQHADDATRAALGQIAATREAARIASRATDADVSLPSPPGRSYLPYQRAGIAYALRRLADLGERPGGVIVGDEMGLGKTIQAIGIVNATPEIRDVLVVCPASLKLNWQRELQRWLTRSAWIGLASTQDLPAPPRGCDAEVRIVIAHYDIFSRRTRVADELRSRTWDLMVADEAHLLKNPKAGRTAFVLGAKGRRSGEGEVPPLPALRRVFLTGTPLVNRPRELFPLLNAAAPEVFGDFWTFARRYCGAVQTRNGWDMGGATNLDELQDRMRGSCMIRRLKRDVLTELPAKVRQVIELPAGGAASVVAREAEVVAAQEARLTSLRAAVELAKASEDPADYAAAVAALKKGAQEAFTEISKRRHETALAKVPYVIEHVSEAAEAGSKVILFAHHKDVVALLAEGLAALRPVIVTGDTALVDRQGAVDAFQTDERVRLFIGNMQAAGVGLTLTASSHVVFAELDWVPGNLSQCEDRAHRIGQTSSVLVQHLVLEGSIDARMAEVIVEKQAILDAALDTDTDAKRAAREARERAAMDAAEAAVRRSHDGEDGFALADRIRQARERAAAELAARPERRPVNLGQPAATEDATPDSLAAEGAEMTEAQIAAVHAALRTLAGMDEDGARDINGVGFNKLDTNIGRSLAARGALTPRQAALGRKLVRKYHRQIGADAIRATGAELPARAR